MKNAKEIISEFVDNLDVLSTPFHEHKISDAVNSFIKERRLDNPPSEWLAEQIAFSFIPNYSNAETGWGTYYGPMWVMPNGDGMMTESPSIRRVTSEIIDYWEERSRSAKHPILKLRYADLVWDFSKKVSQKSPHFSVVHTIIDSTIEIARKKSHKYETDVITKFKRALSLAILINDTQRIESLRDAIVKYEDEIAEDKKAGLWGFSFDLLLNNKKVPLGTEIKDKIIWDLENRLARLADIESKESLDPWGAEAAALRLAKYYKSLNQSEDAKRVMLKFGVAFETASENAEALQASAWLQRVHSLYLENGLPDEADKIAIKIKELGPKVNAGMKSITQEIKITDKEMTDYVNAIVDVDFEKTLMRIAIHFVPKKDATEKQLKQLAKKAPISFLISKQIQDHEGRPVGFIGSLEDDLIGNIVHQTSQNMHISSIFLRPVIQELISRFKPTAEGIVDYLCQCQLFSDHKKAMLLEGVRAYIDGNHMVAIHILIPQVESAFRMFVELTGGAVLKPARGGGMYLKTLDELLRDQRVVTVFGEDMPLYFRILLTDQRGWNLRNDVCHGISPDIAFVSSVSDRVFHVLLCLSLVRMPKQNES